MIINHNMAAHNAQRQYGVNTSKAVKNLEKLSSGLQINRAGDDASGLAISEKMRAQIYGLEMAAKNTLDGISLVQTGEGSLQETHEMLHRLRELAVQASSDTNIDSIDRVTLQAEVNDLLEGIDQIVNLTEFNRQKIIDGSFADKKFHIGPNSDQNITFSIQAMDLKGLKLDEGLKIDLDEIVYGEDGQPITRGGILSQADADAAITRFDEAINILSSQRAALGGMENSLEHTLNSLGIAIENLTAAKTRILSTDMAEKFMEFTMDNILIESSQAMIAQANQTPEGVLNLLR